MRLSTQRFANGSFLYTEKSVYRRYELPDNELALSRKKGSTAAYQAFYDVNLEKRFHYGIGINLPYPRGV